MDIKIRFICAQAQCHGDVWRMEVEFHSFLTLTFGYNSENPPYRPALLC